MTNGSFGKEIPLKSISDEVVFCHPILNTHLNRKSAA